MGAVFTPNTERTFTKKVGFNVPTESGAFTQVALPVTFKSVPKSELTELQEECSDLETYQRVVTGVGAVGDAEGNELPLAKGKDAMAEESSFVYEAIMTYYDVMLGGNLKRKTSGRRRATG